MPDFPLKRLSSMLRRTSNEEIAINPEKTLSRTNESLSMLNDQMDEAIEHFLTKKLTKKIHEADTFDQIPDELEGGIAAYVIKLTLYVMRDVVKELVARDIKRQEAMDAKEVRAMDRLLKSIKQLSITFIISFFTIIGWVFRYIIIGVISGEIPVIPP